MFDATKLPARNRRFVDHGAPEGERQREAFSTACQCRDAGATEAETRELVEQGAARCGLPASEARAAVRSAYKHPAREAITKGQGSNGDKPSRKPRVVKRYDYTDAAGVLLYQVERTEPKGFRQRRPDGKGGWVYNLEGVARTLYRLPTLATAGEIWIAEGEKDCDTLAGLGFVATCNGGGAGKWPHDHAAHFTGKRVVIVPDADTPGKAHAEQVARALHGVAASVRVLRLPEGVKDVSAYAETFSDTGELAERLSVMAEGAELWQPKPEAVTKPSGLQIVSAADLLAKDFPDAADIVADILPKRARLILSAPAKLGKTRFALGLSLAIAAGKSAMGFQITEPARVLYLYAEGGERMMQDRLRKMLTGFDVDETALRERLLLHHAHGLKLTNPAHVERVREAIATHQPAIVAVDPLYKFHAGDESSVRDMTAFFDPLDALISEQGVSVLLIHHHGKASGDGLATQAHRNRGSSTIADWADSLLTLTFEDADAGIVKLSYTLRHAEEPEPAAFYRNPETLWFDVLHDHQFAGKGSRAKITDAEVAGVIGKGATAYRQLVEKLRERFSVSDGTARATIRRATQAGAISKDEGTGLYVSTR
jgi:hypothetical protein